MPSPARSTRRPGFAAKQSLVQFDATANVPYHVQIGSRDGSEGDVFTNVSYQPPGGGLSATLVALNGFSIAYQGRNYECGFFGSAFFPCSNPTYLVHNSTSQPLEVTPASTLGAGIVAPAKFTLGAGKARAVTFVIGNAFDKIKVAHDLRAFHLHRPRRRECRRQRDRPRADRGRADTPECRTRCGRA